MIHLHAIECERLPGTRDERVRHVKRCVVAVAQASGLSVKKLTGQRKPRCIAWPRQVGYHVASEVTGASLPEIGEAFGWRDHTTVLHGIRQVDARIAAGHVETLDLIERSMTALDTGTCVPVNALVVNLIGAAVAVVGEDGWRARQLAGAALVRDGDSVSSAAQKVIAPDMARHRFAKCLERMAHTTSGYDNLVIDMIGKEASAA